MEISDILIFILAAIGVTISALTKNAKKKAEEARRLTRTQTDTDTGQWGGGNYHTRDSEEITHSWDELHAPSPQEKKYWSYDDETIKVQQTTPRIDDSHRQPKHSKETRQSSFEDSTDKVLPDATGKSPSQRFNLRDAIIYNELLKPKHEEY